MQEIKWKMEGFGKGIEAPKVAEELKRISDNNNGSLTAEIIVDEAKKEKSILHTFFEWDDTVAAMNYRLQQARNLINNISITVIHHGEKREIGAYEIINVGDGRKYKSVDVFTSEDINQVRIKTMQDIKYLKDKLSYYNALKSAVPYLEQAITELNNLKGDLN